MVKEKKDHLKQLEIDEKELHKLVRYTQGEIPTNFEDAISLCGFGKFNYFLLFCIFFPSATQMTETVAISYILPVAECDLNLSLEDKGILNAVTFAGMIVSGLLWGYMCDALGRKQIIVYGYLATGCFSIIAAISTNKFILIVSKFIGGLILNGPFSASTSHMIEFHSSGYRGKINMIRGMFLSLVNLGLPLLAWAILPRKLDLSIFGLFGIRSWNLFLLVCAIGPIMSGILYIFIPESPKFLMASGRNRAALQIMKKVYVLNTGNPEETFPIKRLAEETSQTLSSRKDLSVALRNGYSEMKTIFKKTHIKNLALVCFNAFALVMSLNTLKLWLPGIFQSINDYQQSHNGTSNSMCIMLESMDKVNNVSSIQNCSVNLDNLSVYISTFTVAGARVAAFAVAGTLVKLLGTRKLTIILCLLSATLMFCIYFAKNSLVVTILSAAGSAVGSVPENLLVTITLELFPTTLRTIALSVHLMCSRLGTLIGNIIFPYLVHIGCLPPFLFIGMFASACGIGSCLYSNIENKPLV